MNPMFLEEIPDFLNGYHGINPLYETTSSVLRGTVPALLAVAAIGRSPRRRSRHCPARSKFWCTSPGAFGFEGMATRTLVSLCISYVNLLISIRCFKVSCAKSKKCVILYFVILYWTSRTAQSGAGSFKDRKPIEEVSCCGAWISEKTDGSTGGWSSETLSFYIYLPTYLPTYLSINRSIYLPIYLPIYLLYLSIHPSIHPSVYLFIYLSIWLSIYLSIHLSIHPCIHLSIHPSIYPIYFIYLIHAIYLIYLTYLTYLTY